MIEHFIEALYLTAALVAIGACVPQLKQLIHAKASDELNLSSWLTWMCTQCVTLLYVISIHSVLMTIVNIAWVSFYASMVFLIVRYRRRPASAPLTTVEEPAA